MKKLLLAVLALAVLGAAAAGGTFLWAEAAVRAPGPAGDGAELRFEVPKGANARSVAARLEQERLVGDARLFRFHVWRRGGLQLKAGAFTLKRGMSIAELATALEQAPLAEDEPFVVVEGFRLRDTDAALAARGLIQPGAYVKAASEPSRYQAPFRIDGATLEGYLYPETYRVVPGTVDVHALVQRQLDTFVERVWKPHQEAIAKSPRTLHELVTMASMLEREEPLLENRPLVAGILWKRIDRRFPLGVDATSRYELPEWNDRKAFLNKHRDTSDAYNPRHKPGLPPSPIGAPTEGSFRAALAPVQSEFLYYLHDAQKQLHPSRNAAEHEALRKKYDVY